MTEKLVRDRIPDILRSLGMDPVTRVASEEEYPGLLRDKLLEEVEEFIRSGETEELADILEVVYALAELGGADRDFLEGLRAGKAQASGGLSGRVVWSGNRREDGTVNDGSEENGARRG